jgi:hypothetical protein
MVKEKESKNEREKKSVESDFSPRDWQFFYQPRRFLQNFASFYCFQVILLYYRKSLFDLTRGKLENRLVSTVKTEGNVRK